MELDEDFIKEILIYNVRNIKSLSENIKSDFSQINTFKQMSLLKKVYEQITNLHKGDVD